MSIDNHTPVTTRSTIIDRIAGPAAMGLLGLTLLAATAGVVRSSTARAVRFALGRRFADAR